MSHDSAVLITVAGRSVLHTNDARISLAQTRRAMAEIGGPFDLMGTQMSGASWHPVRYEYDEVERERISTIKRVGKFKAVTRLVRSVQPRLVMPYAGPPCFLDDELFELNSGLQPGGIFPDQGEALAWLAERLPEQPGVCLLPGDRVELGGLDVIRDLHWQGFSLDAGAEERHRYLTEYAARRRTAIAAAWAANPPAAPGLGERLKAHFESLGTLSEYFLARIGMNVRFEVSGPGGGVWMPTSARTRCSSTWTVATATRTIGWYSMAAGSTVSSLAVPGGRSCFSRFVSQLDGSPIATTTTWWAC